MGTERVDLSPAAHAPSDSHSRVARQSFALGPEDRRALERGHAQREHVVDALIDRFYTHLLGFGGVAQFLRNDPNRLGELERLHRSHFLNLGRDGLDVASLVGTLGGDGACAADGFSSWYVGISGLYLSLAVGLLSELMGEGPDFVATVSAVIKAVMLDLAVALDSYMRGFVPPQTAAEMADAAAAATEALRKEQNASRSKDELVNMIVHDLRNPVQGIALQANVALQIAAKSLDAERDHLTQIERSCQNLSRLLQDMLEAARLEAGDMPVAVQPTPLGALVDEVLEQHRPMLEEAGIRLTRAVNRDLPTIRADPALLRRVLTNLIVNAIRHSGSKEIRVEAAAGGRAIATRVIDYGRGIPRADQGRIFEKYASGTPAEAHAPGASGLGLYFCRLATERMGGRLELTSEPGLTTFEIYLPAA